MTNAPALEIERLCKSYGRTSAVAGLSLRAERSLVTASLGPNGAGKTTTVEICEGYRRPDSGLVRVLGLDPVRDARVLRPTIGVMLQAGGIPAMVERTLWSRGDFDTAAVTGGIPDGALRHDPRSGTP